MRSLATHSVYWRSTRGVKVGRGSSESHSCYTRPLVLMLILRILAVYTFRVLGTRLFRKYESRGYICTLKVRLDNHGTRAQGKRLEQNPSSWSSISSMHKVFYLYGNKPRLPLVGLHQAFPLCLWTCSLMYSVVDIYHPHLSMHVQEPLKDTPDIMQASWHRYPFQITTEGGVHMQNRRMSPSKSPPAGKQQFKLKVHHEWWVRGVRV